jgi:hypothetical protein
VGGILDFDVFQPGVFPGRLVKMSVNANAPMAAPTIHPQPPGTNTPPKTSNVPTPTRRTVRFERFSNDATAINTYENTAVRRNTNTSSHDPNPYIT